MSLTHILHVVPDTITTTYYSALCWHQAMMNTALSCMPSSTKVKSH